MPLTDERLSEMIRMLPKCGIVADIGTDHGRLGAQLLLTGKCGKVWFSDISAPSLEKARGLIAQRGLQERAEFFVGDGARALPGAPDAAVIAAHEVFQRRGDIIAEFQESYQTWCQRIAKLVVEDSETQVKDGSYLEYSKTTIDEAVRDALTDKYFLPWDTRHQIEGRENKKETGA